MEELISVIVPIYNVEQYLPRCIDSLTRQTYQNIEIILVDDESPDHCGQICEDYASRDARIKVIHKKNGGLSDARNVGMDAAKGSCFFFVDSDDYIHIETLERLHNLMEEQGAEVAICTYKKVTEDAPLQEALQMGGIQTAKTPKEKEMLCSGSLRDYATVAWNKLYKASLWEEIRYPKGKIHEDEFTTYKIMDRAQGITFVDTPMYYYFQREDSIMGEGFNEKSLHRFEAYDQQIAFYGAHEKYICLEDTLDMYRIFYLRMRIFAQEEKQSLCEPLAEYKKHFNKHVKKYISKCPGSWKKKLGFLAMCYMEKAYRKRYQGKHQ